MSEMGAEYVQVRASHIFYGVEQLRLASPLVTFTRIPDRKNPSELVSVINFKICRETDDQVIDVNLHLVMIQSMTFSSDTSSGPLMVLRIPGSLSLSIRYHLQTGSQYTRIMEHQLADPDDLYKHLTFVLQGWPEKRGMYTFLGLGGFKVLGDYRAFLAHAKKYETIREAEYAKQGLKGEPILGPVAHPPQPYFYVISDCDLKHLLDEIGLDFVYEGKADGIGANVAQLPWPTVAIPGDEPAHSPEAQKETRGAASMPGRPVESGMTIFAPSTPKVERPSPVSARTLSKKPAMKNENGSGLEDELGWMTLDDVFQNCAASKDTTSNASIPEPEKTIEFTEETPMVDFPKNARGGNGIHIRGKDMQRVARTELLNDTIIEFGIKYIFHRLNDEKLRSATHTFSTYFFSTLAPNPSGDRWGSIYLPQNKESRTQLLKGTYQRLKRWTKKTDIFSKKYIVVPVNSDFHWYLIVIVNPGKSLRRKDEPTEDAATADPEEICQLFLFDSLPDPDHPKRACILPIMREYLNSEFEDKKKKNAPNLYFSPQYVCQVRINGLPVQKNLVDCGVYLLAYLEFFFQNPPKVPWNRVVEMSEWCPFFRLGYIEFYRDKIIARIKGLCDPPIWNAFEKYEREAHRQNPRIARVTVYNEADLVDLGRRPRRHECYSCPDPVKPEPTRPRSASVPLPGVLVPALNRVKHIHE